MKKWSEVAGSDEFKALPRPEQEQARTQYFEQVVAPRVDPADVDRARQQFEQDTVLARQPLPEGVSPSGVEGGRGLTVPTAPPPPAPPAADITAYPMGRGLSDLVTGRAPAPAPEFKPGPGGSVLDQPYTEPLPPQPYNQAALVEQSKSPERVAREARIADYSRPRASMRASPDLGTGVASVAESLRGKDDGSVAYLAREFAANATAGSAQAWAQFSEAAAGATEAAGDAAGLDAVAKFGRHTADAAKEFQRMARGPEGDSIVQQAFASVVNNAVLLPFGAATVPLMGLQQAGQSYAEARKAGKSPLDALDRAAWMGVAEGLGEKFSVPTLQRAFATALRAGGTSKELAHTLAQYAIKEQIGEQATTAFQDLYDKAGIGGLRRDMTLEDYLHDAVQTAKVTLLQSTLMGAGAGGLRKLAVALDTPAARARRADAENTALFDRYFAPPPGDGGAPLPPTKARSASIERFGELAAAHGLDPDAEKEVRTAASAMPSGEVPGFLTRVTRALTGRGLFAKPVDAGAVQALEATLSPPAEGAEGEQAAAVQDAAQQAAADEAAGAAPGRTQEVVPGAAGAQLDRKWTAFAPESGTLDIPREQMPQVAAEHRGALVNFLAARGVTHEVEQDVAPELLQPSQREFSPEKVQAARDFTGGDRAILVSADDYILDGTHQWLAKLEAGEPVKVIRLDAPIDELIRLTHSFPSSTTARGASTKAGGGGVYTISDAISADGPVPETVRLIVRPDGASAIQRDNGDVIDVTNMIRAGFTPERAIAQSLGDDTSGANVSARGAAPPAAADRRRPPPAAAGVDSQAEPIPTGEATDMLPVGETTEGESPPVGEATEIPEGEAVSTWLGARAGEDVPLIQPKAPARAKPLPVGEATEIEPEDVAPAGEVNQDQRGAEPVAESQAPAPSEPGEGAVASAPAGAAPDLKATPPARAKAPRGRVPTAANAETPDDAVIAARKREAQTTASRVAESRDVGTNAFAEGKPRQAPSSFTTAEKKAWLDGWDAANEAEPAATQQEPAVEPAPAAKAAPTANTIFTEDAAAAARARLKAKLGRVQSGIDPETMLDGITLAGYHIEKGARTFAAYAKAMIDDLGDAVRPYLKSWYMGVKFDPRATGFDGMDDAATVEKTEVEQAEAAVDLKDVPPPPPEAPAEATTEKDADGNPIFTKGQRVVLNDKAYEGMAGRHGVVSDVNVYRWTTMAYGGGAASKSTGPAQYQYTVKTDAGVETSARGDQMAPEVGEAPKVAPDVKIKAAGTNGWMTPESVQRSIDYARQSMRQAEGKLARAKVEKSKKEWREQIATQKAKMEAHQAALDAWRKEHGRPDMPAASPDKGPDMPAASPASPAQTGQAMTVQHTKHTKTGADLWVVKIGGGRLERADYDRIASVAKRNGGIWSKFTKGFNFASEGGATDFVKAAGGSAAPAAPKVELGEYDVAVGNYRYTLNPQTNQWFWTGRPGAIARGQSTTAISEQSLLAKLEAAWKEKQGVAAAPTAAPAPPQPVTPSEAATIVAPELAREDLDATLTGRTPQAVADAAEEAGVPPEALTQAIAAQATGEAAPVPLLERVLAAMAADETVRAWLANPTNNPQQVADALVDRANGLVVDLAGDDYEGMNAIFERPRAEVGPEYLRELRLRTGILTPTLQPEARHDATPAASPPPLDRAVDDGEPPAPARDDEGDSIPGLSDDASLRGVGGRLDGVDDVQGDVGTPGADAPIRDATPRTVGKRGGRVPASDFRPEPGGLTREGTWFDAAKRNLDLIDLARKIEAEDRPVTPDEQAQLSKYVGFGASEIRNNLFPVAQEWQKRDAPVGALIFPEAVRSAQWKPLAERAAALPIEWQRTILQSTQYAHYTSEGIIRSIWSGVQRLGFTGGKVFEPGGGIGSFAMLMPDSVHKTSTFMGIEFDGPTALIARMLSPQQQMLHDDFIKRRLPDDFFDVTVGNPPFAATKITSDPTYAKYGFSLHDYFFAKAIDKLRPGGLMAYVTSRFSMDKQTDKARKYLAERADLLGAIRLPSTAFEANAGTSVVTDVIFLRKRMPGEAPGGQAWEKVATIQTKDGPTVINEYFVAHPEMVLGQHRLSGHDDDMGRRINSNTMGYEQYTVVSYDESPAELDAKFAAAVKNLPENVYAPMAQQPAQAVVREVAKFDFDPKVKREGVVYIGKDGDLLRVEQGVGKALGEVVKLSDKDVAWLKGYVGLRDAIKTAQMTQVQDGDWEPALKKLNKVYDAFVKQHGYVNDFRIQTRKTTDEDGNEIETPTRIFKNKRLYREDYDYTTVIALETINEDGEIKKGPFLLGRTIGKPVSREIKTIGDALAVSLDETGRLNLDDIAQRINITRDEAIEALGSQVYKTPAGQWQLSDEYLSGDVVAKLAEAITAARIDPTLDRNVKALEAVQPEKLGPSQISVKLGAPWVDEQHVNDFASEIGAGAVTFDQKTESWQVAGATQRSGRNAAAEFGTADRSPSELLEAILNSRALKVMKTEDKKTVVDTNATQAANDMATKIKDKFKSWVWLDSERAADLVEAYNERYNNIAPRRFDGSHLTLPGVSLRFKLHQHQLTAIWRQIQTGNTYLAHAVGAGKTIEAIAGGMEQKRLGLIKKPIYVVPNHMLEQFSNEFMDLYPLANIMVADDQNFSKERRKAFVAAATLNAPDAIVITHSAFGFIGVKPESVDPIRDEILADLEAEMQDAAQDKGARVRRSQLEQQIEAVNQRFDSILAAGKRDGTVSFEEMGIDFVYVDEAHVFRKLDFHTAQAIKGIDPNGSRRALDLYIKTRFLEKKNPGRSMVFMSGTPVTNTMGELYSIMRFFDPDTLVKAGISTFDSWARMFGEVGAALEPNAAGKYEMVTRFSKFDNVPELMSRVRQFMDVLQSDQLGAIVKRPNVKGGKPNLIIVPPTQAMKDYQKNVLEPRLIRSRAWKPSPQQPFNPDPVLSIITDGRFAATDPRFIPGGKIAKGETTKMDEAAARIIETYKTTKNLVYVDRAGKPMPTKGATQIVFYNVGFGATSAASRGFNSRQAFTKRLVDGGIKRDEIAWFDDADTDAKKEAVFKGMRAGTFKVLIGSAKKMGTGVNVQNRLIALQYLDPPWFPADVEQPRGRIIRQGNQNDEIEENWYATKGGYDSTMWQMVGRKQRFIDQAFSGDKNLRSMDDLGEASLYEQAAALASGDPRALQLAGLKQDVERLERQQAAHASEQLSARSALRNAEWEKESAEKREKTYASATAIIGDYFRFEDQTGTVGGRTYAKQGEFGEAIKRAFNANAKAQADAEMPKTVVLGTIGNKGIEVKAVPVISSENIKGTKEWRKVRTENYEITVSAGKYEDEATTAAAALGEETDAVGLTRKIVNVINGVDNKLRQTRRTLEDNAVEMTKLRKKIGAPFEHQAEMLEKYAALKALEEELRLEDLAKPPAPATPAAPDAPADEADDDDASFSIKTAAPARTQTAPSLRAALEREFSATVVKALEAAGRLYVANAPLPGMPASAVGVTSGAGEIGLFAGNIPAGSVAVAYHEALHATLRKTIGPAEFDALMARLAKIGAAARKGSPVDKFFAGAVERVTADTAPGKRAEELAAYAVEQFQRSRETMPSIIRKWVEDFIAALRAGLAAALRAANVAPAVRARLIADPAVLHKLARDGLKALAREQIRGDMAGASAFSEQAPPLFSRRGDTTEPESAPPGSGVALARQKNTPAEIRAAKAAIARIEAAGGVTSPDDLRDVLRVSGYSQWAQSPIARDVDATARLWADLEAGFTFGERPVLTQQGVISIDRFIARDAESVAKVAELADRYGAPVIVRGHYGDFDPDAHAAMRAAGFERYRGLQEIAGRAMQWPEVGISWIRPAGGISSVTPLFSLAPQTDTKTFKDWFGDSKVVDAEGRPLVVYHGTAQDFAQFDMKRGGDVWNASDSLDAMWFTSSTKRANAASKDAAVVKADWDTSNDAVVMPVYLRIANPFRPTARQIGDPALLGKAMRSAKERGHDGVVMPGEMGGHDYAVFDSAQVKSATGNRGTFDPADPDIRYSIAPRELARKAAERAVDVARIDTKPNVLQRKVGFPFALSRAHHADGSLKHPEFRVVYDEGQDYLTDINTFANDPAELAPDVVPQLNGWRGALPKLLGGTSLRLSEKDRAAIAPAIYEGTLVYTRDAYGLPVEADQNDPNIATPGIVWTHAELRARYDLNSKQIVEYDQARAALGRSLDFMAAAEVARHMGKDLPKAIKSMVSDGDLSRFKGLVGTTLVRAINVARSDLKAQRAIAKLIAPTNAADVARAQKRIATAEAEVVRLVKLQKDVDTKYKRVQSLKDRGYFPLMRFGTNTVTVRGPDGKVQFFSLYETEAEANVVARKFRENQAFADSEVKRGELTTEQFRLFKGISPETLALFGELAGVNAEDRPLLDKYLQMTKANHSALRRLIRRKGTAGYSEDVQRTMAAFLTSNARAASTNLHAGDMTRAVANIPQESGEMNNYATRLTEYVQNPTDEASALRGFLFIHFIGGSLMSAATNLTQTATQTHPYLASKSNPVTATRIVTQAMADALLTRVSTASALGAAIKHAQDEGIISPQALHELQGQAMNRLGSTESMLRALGLGTTITAATDTTLRKLLYAWGGFFSLAEQYNRRVAFIAAWRLANEQGVADPIEFASEAVKETQNVYNRGNRPEWGRSAVGATVMTYSQFKINYVEFLIRLGPKKAAIALLMLALFSGYEGLPFSDDFDDLLDTIMQRMFGKAWSTKLERHKLVAGVFGEHATKFILHGVSALPGFPIDFAGRLSLGNMVPGTGLGLKSARDKTSEVLEGLGPAGGVARDVVQKGEIRPIAIRNLSAGLKALQTGEIRDPHTGKLLGKATPFEAAAKAVGANPATIATESRKRALVQRVIDQVRAVENGIVDKWAEGMVEGDRQQIQAAILELRAWNAKNPNWPITVDDGQLARAVAELQTDRKTRFIKSVPRDVRATVMRMTGAEP